MKNATEYAKKLRRALAGARAAAARSPSRVPNTDVTGHIILSQLMRFAPDGPAAAGFRRIREATVDVNELRVTTIAELIDMVGSDFPQARVAAEAVLRALNAVFNRCHHLDLAFLQNMGKREAREWLDSLDGMTPFSAAVVVMRALGHHAVPIDDVTLEWLRSEKLIDPTADTPTVQAFFERLVPSGREETWFTALRRVAWTRGSRRARPVPADNASPTPPPTHAPAKPVRAVRKRPARVNSSRRATARAKPAARSSRKKRRTSSRK
ncbi:MAG: hypothetical protein HUU27_06445 [Phycisphaerae bacterium]|nr:hypothetical protein [Phycisphaerae bacterium]NUQ49543.1 hypothetical protein [Phycisphaerae bacterium]